MNENNNIIRFIYLVFHVAFDTVQAISPRVVLWAEETKSNLEDQQYNTHAMHSCNTLFAYVYMLCTS